MDILLTSFNVAHWLGQAINSVLEQTYGNLHLLLMDDGSTDPAVGTVLDAVDDPRVTVVRFNPTIEERRASCRYATLINWGFQRTRGEYITYLCSDDYYLPDRLERMVATMREGVDVVYGAQLCLDKDDNLLSIRETAGVLASAPRQVDHNSILQTRASFKAAEGWPTDPSLWSEADAAYFQRLNDAGYDFYPVPGGPTDAKRYHPGCIGDMTPFGLEPWELVDTDRYRQAHARSS